MDASYFRMLCDHSGVAMIGTDTDLLIRFWNQAASRLFGAGMAQMLGTPVISVIPQQARNQAERMFWRAVIDREVGSFDFSAKDSKGKRRQLAAVVSPVLDDNDEVIGTSACVRDITHNILLQEQLGKSQKMASLGSMAGAMAHYFNNILGGIVTSVDFALASDDAFMQKRVLEKTAKGLARASALVEGLLTFAEGNRRSTDLADLTETLLFAIAEVEPELERAGVELRLDLQPIPITAVPFIQLETVLVNVLHNAVEAMKDGGVLSIYLGPAADAYVIRVSDTGVGLSEELRERIFEPFYSTKSSLEEGERVGRPGLGLAVAHGILNFVGGSISVQSAPGKGATFEIRLPAVIQWPVEQV